MVDVALMVNVARLYYEESRTQVSIAKELGITRLSVIELLKTARAEGIVRIEIVNPKEDFSLLEEIVAQKYRLKKVIIVPGKGNDTVQLPNHLARSAVSYLAETIEINDIVGIGWGLTVMEITKQLKEYGRRSIVVVPLIGGGNERQAQYDVNSLTKRFASAFGGESYSLFAPAVVDSKVIRDVIVTDSKIRQVTDFWKRMNVALIGIGVMTKEFPTAFNENLTANPIDFKEKGIVGDVLSRFYGIEGNDIPLELHERMIGIDFSTLRKTETVIGVAGGLAKYNAIYGAIKGSIINVLITDENVARKLAKHS